MKRLLSLGLAVLCLLCCSLAHANWNPQWTKRLKIGLDTSASGVALQTGAEAVPLLLRLHTGNFPFIDAKPDGADLRFIGADDKTPLKFHIEKFDAINELALVWVELPRIPPNSKADFIWLYYGNANATPAADAKSSYDAAQALVFHFGEKELLPQDATANANHAARSTAKTSAAGLIGGALSFDGNAELQVAASPSLKSGSSGLTVSFWIKPAALDDAVLLAQDGAKGLNVALKGGKLVAQAGGLTASATAPAAGVWQHVAVVASPQGLAVHLNGQEAARVAGSVAELAGALSIGKGFKGELDEFAVASVARTPDWIRAVALSQGPEQKLASVAPAEGSGEEGSGPSTLRILLGAVTIDGWVVIGILMVMFAISVAVMVNKTLFVRKTTRANDRFKGQFAALVDAIQPGAESAAPAKMRHSSLYRLYAAGAQELRHRLETYAKAGREPFLSDAAINAIRASVDARMVRESQRLNSRMVLLTIAIAGGPFLGLLGTVVGVMITFAAIAAAGDVNVNAIAPGIAAALVATVAGLAVAIPALFGYNYLSSRISELQSDMQAFVDEFITRIAEKHCQ